MFMSEPKAPFHKHVPLRLLRNVTYPAYQLYAVAGSDKKTPPEQVMTLAVLETLHWLRKRFRDFEIPEPLRYPEAGEYQDVSWNDLHSFQINEGYKAEALWLPEEKIWAFQLTEPDLGPDPGAPTQTRQPVPGRIIETNIGYRLLNGQVECGFRTMVSDVEGTTASFEVYRLSVIKHLARNALVGLRQGWQLLDQEHVLAHGGDLELLRDWLKSPQRMMPAVIITAAGAGEAQAAELPSIDEASRFGGWRNAVKAPAIELPEVAEDKGKAPSIPAELADLVRYRMGYAQFFYLPEHQISAFVKKTGQSIHLGEVLLIEPAAFEGAVMRFDFTGNAHARSLAAGLLEDLVQNYPMHKPMSFGHVAFLSAAKEISHDSILKMSHSKEDVLKAMEGKIGDCERKLQVEKGDHLRDIATRDEKIKKLSQECEELKTKNQELRLEKEELKKRHHAELEDVEQENRRLLAYRARPARPEQVCDWVKKNFADRMIFHTRAQDEMKKVGPNELDLQLLCDALEFLATDYRDELLGQIDGIEMQRRCARKYGRPFEVTPVKGASVEAYPKNYKIKYYEGYKGKPVESTLDLHLKVGNQADHMLRIYFLYDKEKQLIVVGSLPWHMKTVGYR
jgi:Skp family chaperone for outer membrane proteins